MNGYAHVGSTPIDFCRSPLLHNRLTEVEPSRGNVIIRCDRCKNRFAPAPDMQGHTIRCQVCGDDLYIPLFEATDRNAGDGPVMLLTSAPITTDPEHGDCAALSKVSISPRLVHSDSFWLVVGGWALLLTGLLIRCIITPTTFVLSWLAVFLAIAAGIILFVRRNRRAALALVIAGILLPTAQSILFWYHVGQEADRVAKQVETDLQEMTEKMSAELDRMSRPTAITPHPHVQPIAMPRFSPPVIAPVQPAVDWAGARKQVRVAGVALKNGTSFAVVNGKPMPQASNVRTVLANREYSWRISIQGQSVNLEPIACRPLR